MATFTERMEELLTYMGISQSDLGRILGSGDEGVPRSTVNNWFSKDQTPTFAMLLHIADRFSVSVDWLTGRPVPERWDYRVRDMRMWLKTTAKFIEVEDIHQRMVAVVDQMKMHLPLANEPRFMAGVLGFGADNAKENLALYERWLDGKGATSEVLENTMARLAEFTGLPEKWIMKGDASLLKVVTSEDLGEWAAIVAEYRRMGHTVEQHRRNAPLFDTLIKHNER